MTNNPNYPIQTIGCKDMQILVSDTEIKVSIREPRLGVENIATISDPIDDLPMPHSYLVIKMPESAHFKTLIIGLTQDPKPGYGYQEWFAIRGKYLSIEPCVTASEIELFLNKN